MTRRSPPTRFGVAGDDASNRTARPAPHVAAARQADRIILLDLRGGRYYALDGVAVTIWELLEQGRSTQEIQERLAEEFDAPPTKIATDLRAFVEQLGQRGLIS